jgi:chromosome segregation ATPase
VKGRGSLSERAYRDARIITLQGRLFDHSGHVTRGLSRDAKRALFDEINYLREANGFASLALPGRPARGTR